MKRALSLVLITMLSMSLFSGCGKSETAAAPEAAPADAAAPTDTDTDAASAAVEDEYVVRVAYDFLDDSFLGENFKKFSDRVTELSDGKIKFNIYGSGSLYNANQALEATMVGDLEMCVVANSNIGNYCPEMLLFSLPFLIPNYDALEEMLNPEGELMRMATANFGSKNLEYLNTMAFVPTDISSNKQIKVPSDMDGMKIRVYGQTNSIFTDLSKGASVFLSGGEVVQALSSNTIDGAWCGVESMVTRKYYEFQDYICACGAERSDQSVVMCKSWWDELPVNVQSIIKTAMDEMIAEEHVESYDVGEKAREDLAEFGAEVYYPTDEELKQWHEIADEVYVSFYETVGEDLIKKAVSIRDKYM